MTRDHSFWTVAAGRSLAGVLAAALLVLLAPTAQAEEAAPSALEARAPAPVRWGDANRAYSLRAVGELGFLAVLSHKVQFGRDGTYLDYVTDGGQDTLFAAARLSLELGLFQRHRVILLYQPLAIETVDSPQQDLVVDGETFQAGQPVSFLYGFPFYRLSYIYDFFASSRLELSLGLSLQIRNATITFQSGDGELFRSSRDIGFVPLIKLRFHYAFDCGFWLGAEVDGVYAPVSYLNGDSNDVTGALIDLSVRAGITLPRGVQPFLNVRYLAGGATGAGTPDPPADGYVRNWLHFMTVTVGVNWDVL